MLKESVPSVVVANDVLAKARITIVRALFHDDLTGNMERHCIQTLKAAGLPESNIKKYTTPGSLEIPVTAKLVAQQGETDLMIVFGIVRKGDTYHFETVVGEAARGCMDVGLQFGIPIIFEVIGVYDMKQAEDRAGDHDQNKGIYAAYAALTMLNTLHALGKL